MMNALSRKLDLLVDVLKKNILKKTSNEPSQKLTLFTLFLIFTIPSAGFASLAFEDDKKKHFAVSAVACGATMLYTKSWWQSMAVGAVIGVGKEIYDSRQPDNKFSKGDIFFDAAGCLTGASIGSATIYFGYDNDIPSINIRGLF